ncbi:recombinase family protein [Catalinimonas sp. 4WD22]|uniref:recombinase family protein n=1 Tax=Catalinimonas locisalis TaxID=3133978 RepID=UPI00310168A9
MKFIAYYRVSTKAQGRSGLGLEGQKKAVYRFLKDNDQIVQEYVEVESGKRNNRPELEKAIQHVQQIEGKLLIAKLDRLSRNARFIFTLRDTHVPFVAADMPDANNLTVGIMAVLADHERQMISERTHAALQALIARGKQLGTPDNLNEKARMLGEKIRVKNAYFHPNNRRAGAFAISLYKQRLNYTEIARQLNEHGFTTRRNCSFTHVQVKRLIERYDASYK